jgi:hypothetical protein
MKIQSLKRWLALFVVAFSLGLVQKNQAFGQNCLISFTGPAGNVLNSFIDLYPNYPNSDAYFNTMVQDANEPIPIGTYLTWCVDAGTLIDPSQGYTVPGTLYSGILLPTCDTNLNNELPPGHSPTSYVSPAVWQQVNYILNHKNGFYFWDIQAAINGLVGGPVQGPSPPYPPFTPANVQSLLDAASANAATWVPQCGDVIGAIYVITNQAGITLTNPVQLLMLEVPYCCVTFNTSPTNLNLGCNPTNIPDINTSLVSASSSCGNSVTITGSKSDSMMNCTGYRMLTYTASDGYGNTATCVQTITWTIDTNAPVIFTSLTNSDLGCNPTNLPTVASVTASVTAVDTCSSSNSAINVTSVDSGSPCGMTRTFTITATDACGNSATNTLVYTWKIDTTAPSVSVPAGSNLGCNPTVTLPTDASVAAQVTALDNCSLQSTNVSHVDVVSPCGTTRTFTVIVTDGCGNTATNTSVYTWTISTAAPNITSVPSGGNLGCNPTTTLPTDASFTAQVVATDTCTIKSIKVTHVDTGSPCGMTRTFTTTVTDGCGNFATKTVAYTWTVDTTAPTISSVPANSVLGCNPSSLPTDASVKALVKATDNCTLVSTNVSHTDSISGCAVTRTFTINATDACGNVSTNKTVVYTWTADTTPPVIICPPNITISNNVTPYCTFSPCDYGSKCDGYNGASILTNCFKKVYSSGYLQCGFTNSNYWIKFTSCTNIQKFVQCGGTPNCLKANYSNPTSCEAGAFAGQTLCLKLNVDFGDYGKTIGASASCGDLILNDPSCPLNGKSVRQILGICNTALGGGSISSYGCTISSLNLICSNLNQSFENCQPSTWCQNHLVVPGITNVSPKVTGYAVAIDKCGSTPVLTYSDVTTAGTCSGAYSIARTWVAVDGCGNSNYCTQTINVGVPKATVCVTGPCDGKCGQTGNYTCCVTNTGSTCFSACKVTACGQSFSCPALNPGQGCSFSISYQYQTGDVGTFNCQATASCTYSTASSPCTATGTCSTKVAKK